jgi:hypothetical protein
VLESNHAHRVACKPFDRPGAVTPLAMRARSQAEASHGGGCGRVDPGSLHMGVLPMRKPLRFQGP